jgi:hypothetical protein
MDASSSRRRSISLLEVGVRLGNMTSIVRRVLLVRF